MTSPDVNAGNPGHRRRPAPSRESRDLLRRYQATMRADLSMLLRLLRGDTLTIAERSKYWDLAVKLGRELGSSIDVEPRKPAEVTSIATKRDAPDYG